MGYSTSLRINLQVTGTNSNTWGDVLDTQALQRLEDGVAGWLTIALTGDVSLTTANGTSDQARMAMLKFTGTGTFSVTVPTVSKRYDVWNACTGTLTLTNGSTSVTVLSGETVSVVTDGNANFSRVVAQDMGGFRLQNLGAPTSNADAATKLYADNLAFTANAGIVPAQTGNSGKVLSTDGVTAAWESVTTRPDYITDQLAVLGRAIALAVSL